MNVSEEFRTIVSAAVKNPSADEIERLDEFLREHPEAIEHGLNLAAIVRAGLVREAASTDPVMQVTLERELALYRDALGYAKSGVLERMLIEQVVVSYVRVQVAERTLTTAQKTHDGVADAERSLGRAQARLLRAIEGLDRLRRRPLVAQFNVAAQQVVQHVVRNALGKDEVR